MVHVAGSLSSTRDFAAVPYLFALVSCAIGWAGDRGGSHRRRLSAILFVVEAVLLVDAILDGRLRVHRFLDSEAIARGVYGHRFGPQHAALVVLAIAAVGTSGLVLRFFRGSPGACLAAFGCILSLCLWCVEVISLHSVDSLLYSRVDGVTRAGLARAAFALMTGAAILWDAFARRADAP